jgi:hypothetical protein
MSSMSKDALWSEAIMDLISESLSVLLLLMLLLDASLSDGGTRSHN